MEALATVQMNKMSTKNTKLYAPIVTAVIDFMISAWQWIILPKDQDSMKGETSCLNIPNGVDRQCSMEKMDHRYQSLISHNVTMPDE